MSKKLLKVVSSTAIASTMLVAAASQAATITPGAGTYSFSGASTLTGLGLELACTLSLTGDVQPTSDGGVKVTVTDGDVTGGFGSGCNLVNLSFPWTATVAGSDIPSDPTQSVPLNFKNVVVRAAGVKCSDEPATVPAIFSNGNPISQPSSFSFNSAVGQCSVMGTVNAESDVNVTQ